ncbi:MAG: indole-3-glycerol-phosphate synthase [bacterium]|nr:indole-3-glycerol-phosphate synthase [bacterium]
MSILHDILRKRLDTRVCSSTTIELRARALEMPLPRDFLASLQIPDELSVIAEIKFRSPSEGVLRSSDNIEYLATSYERNGASALSVLTEQHAFGGQLINILRAKSSCKLPVLRKDFLYDEYDVWESRTSGADAILLIAKMLSREQLIELRGIAEQATLTILLELHDEDDLCKAEGITNVAFGVNHRNLDTLAIDLGISNKLFPLINGIKVAESGLRSRTDVVKMRERGADAVLVGTSFMKHADPGQALAAFLK